MPKRLVFPDFPGIRTHSSHRDDALHRPRSYDGAALGRSPPINRNRHEDPTQGCSASAGVADWHPVLAQSLDGCGDFQVRYEIPRAGRAATLK